MINMLIGLDLAIHETSTGNTVNDLRLTRFHMDALSMLGDKDKYTPHNDNILIS
jgi:hypothetical protein